VIRQKEERLSVLERERKKLGFGEKYHPLSERIKQLDDQIPALQAELDILKIAHLSQEEIITEARDLYSRWPTLPTEEKRRIVETITDRIVIGNVEVEINLFYMPSVVPPKPGGSTAIDRAAQHRLVPPVRSWRNGNEFSAVH